MNRPLIPNFLKKIDKKLLINYPDTWSTRVHLVIYYSLLFSAALALLYIAAPFEPRAYSTIYAWVILTAIVCTIGIIIWLIFLLRFNVFKRFGEQKKGAGLKTFILIFIAIFFMIMPAYIPPIIDSIKTNNKYKSNELVNDANAINIKICQLNYSIVPLKWKADTTQLITDNATNNKDATVIADSVEEVVDSVVKENSTNKNEDNNITFASLSVLADKLMTADSSVKLSDSVYLFYTCPDYTFVNPGNALNITTAHFFTSKEIYKSTLQNFKPIDKPKVTTELNDLLAKYTIPIVKESSNDYAVATIAESKNTKEPFETKMRDKYNPAAISSSMGNINERKYRWSWRALPTQIRLLFYIVMVLTMFIFIFRHCTVKSFFLTFLAVIILAILTTVYIVFNSSGEKTIYASLIIYYIIAASISLSIIKSTNRSTVKGIALNLTTFFTPYLPLIITVFYYLFLHNKYEDSRVEEMYKFRYEQLHYLIAEVVGVFLFMLSIEPVFKKLYRKWYALPEN